MVDDTVAQGLPLAKDLHTKKGRWLRTVFVVLGKLPLWLNQVIAGLAAFILVLVPNRHRRVTWHNLKLCFPELDLMRRIWWLVRSLQESTRGISEMGFLWTRSPGQILGLIREIRGRELLDDALEAGEPILFGAPHLGSWELLNLYLSSRTNCAFLYREQGDSGVEKLIRHSRQRLGASLIRANSGGVRQLIKRLKANDLIGILPDHQPRRGQGVFEPFFGHDAYTMVLFSRLIQRQQSNVIFGYAKRLSFGRGYRIHFRKPDPGIMDPDEHLSCAAMNATVESMARENIFQYEWTYKRFNVRPDGSIYGYGEAQE